MKEAELNVLKVKAFDNLMGMLQGKAEFMRTVHRIKTVPIPVMPSGDEVTAISEYEKVDVYQWRVNAVGSADLKQVLLDEAARQLKQAT